MEILGQHGTSTAALYWVSSVCAVSFTAAEQRELALGSDTSSTQVCPRTSLPTHGLEILL